MTWRRFMKLHYLEIVSPQVEAICLAYQAAAGLQFEPPDELLGGARTARLPDGSLIGIRGPLHASEEPVVRPYWLVADIQAALDAATNAGAEVAHPPLEISGKGTFAIYMQGGVHHGLWQL
jgi:predicted enzyme related to lactoylglutathione lyase